jgi:hypothetical protein
MLIEIMEYSTMDVESGKEQEACRMLKKEEEKYNG